MKSIFLISILLLFFFNGNSQNESKVDSCSLEINSTITVDNVSNFSGGIKRGNTILGLFDFSIDYSLQRIELLKNTSFHGHLIKTAGNGPSENFIGDMQVASNIEGRASHFIYELLMRQKIGSFSFSCGMHDLNSEFIISDYASSFINSSFGIFPAVSLNMPVSIFPTTTFGSLFTYNRKRFDLTTGFYNLNHSYAEEETFHFENHFFQHGYFGISEIRYRWIKNNRLIGEYKIGGYLKRCKHTDDEHISMECVNTINYGIYFIADQALYQFSTGEAIGSFIQIGLSPLKMNFASEYYGAGISLREVSKKYFPQQIGIALGSVKMNNLSNNAFVDSNIYETVIEFTTTFKFYDNVILQPDVQYIINPSGGYDNAFTGILRLLVELN